MLTEEAYYAMLAAGVPEYVINNSAGNVVIIDAGHGGSDRGAHLPGLNEKDVNLDIAKMTQEKIEASGNTALLTRSTDTDPGLAARYSLANKSEEADAFVSIHSNSINPLKSGESIITPVNHDQKESQNLANSIIGASRDSGVKISSDPVYTDTRGLAVLNGTEMPAVLVEVGYVGGNYSDLKDSEYKEEVATGISDGLSDYFNDDD